MNRDRLRRVYRHLVEAHNELYAARETTRSVQTLDAIFDAGVVIVETMELLADLCEAPDQRTRIVIDLAGR